MTQTVLSWLRSYPGLEDLQPEALGAKPGAAGLFCRGLTLMKRQEDILGGELRRKRLEYYLERNCPEDPGTLWLEEFTVWAEANAPVLGEESVFSCGQGQLICRDETGPARYRVTLTFEFTRRL